MTERSAAARLLGLGGEPLILASLSPRRREILRMLGVRHETVVPHVEETMRSGGEEVAPYVERLAVAKARWVPSSRAGYVVLAADTVVHLDGQVLEKPRDAEEAAALLRRLSGRWHEVYTGICLRRLRDERTLVDHEVTRVEFVPLDEGRIAAYVETGEPLDKSGAYGIQGLGGLLVRRIEGCYFNVMGLPLARLASLTGRMEEGRR